MQSADEDSYDQTLGMPEQPGSRHFLSIGEVVDGAYKVLEFIGAGAFGEVYLVRHDILQRNFALKLLRSSGMDDAVRSRFVQEV
ncbi:MAG: Non-specific serine/threonine protein kinase, partial [Cyanobacteriota bacterium erpe_2018_sw_39hr_WHONDRS-SW48-000098_B_bin.30]|nr:Non-specific serine/threonine protein kinase [Cyanobacteriota bacterium erpe_2018_sw_39hr_WHONDRS-SW48-000098_B_bin.30]